MGRRLGPLETPGLAYSVNYGVGTIVLAAPQHIFTKLVLSNLPLGAYIVAPVILRPFDPKMNVGTFLIEIATLH